MIKVLVFGKTGQVASELARRAPEDMQMTFLGREQADLTDPQACAAAVAASDADVVINAAAYTAVDKAEEDEATAQAVNGAAPTAMAEACAAKGIAFLHVSTDYVFEGSGEAPWKVEDVTGPLGAYGRTKLAGEDGVRAAGGSFAIMRTSWVFSSHGNNFVKTMLRLGADRDRLTIVADQIGGPTAAADIADALLGMARAFVQGQGVNGTYHFSGGPDVSWADFAREIFAQAGLTPEVVDIPSSDFPTPAKRPSNSRMDCSVMQAAFSIDRPDWRNSLRDVLADLKEI